MKNTLKVMTYNVHGCVGTDGRIDNARIASVIASYEPDVIALQELDVFRQRSGGVHQTRQIADQLKMDYAFHPAWHISENEQYGDAILSRWPMKVVRAAALPTVPTLPALEPRGALWVELIKDGCLYQIINTHLGLKGSERLAQVQEIVGEHWLADPQCHGPCILCGDLNALPGSWVYRELSKIMKDSQGSIPGRKAKSTFPSRFPCLRLDYIFVSKDLNVEQTAVVNDKLTRVASDHLPLIAQLAFNGPC